MQPCHDPHSDPQSRRNSHSKLPLRRVWTPHLSPQLLRPAPRIKAPKTSSFERQGACVHETLKVIANWERVLKRTHILTWLPPRTEADDWKAASSFSVKKVYLLDLKLWPEGQASNLTRHLRVYWNTLQGRWVPSWGPSSLQLTGISWRGAVHSSFFVANTQGIPFDYLALVASRASVHRSHKTTTNGERVLNWPPQDTADR